MIHFDNSSADSDQLLKRFTSYLYKALDHTMISYCREQRRQREIYNALIRTSPNTGDTEDIYLQSAVFRDQLDDPLLESALKNLNSRYFYILNARIIEGRSFEDIGEELGLKYKGVAAIYYRALRKIREELSKENGLQGSDDSL